MGSTVERLRYLAHEIRILPATESSIQRLNDLTQEAMDTMADHVEEMQLQMKALADRLTGHPGFPPAVAANESPRVPDNQAQAPMPISEPDVLKEADDALPTQAPDAAA